MVGNTTTKFQKLDLPFEIKQLDEDLGLFVGYAAAYALDLVKDRIPPGAFARTLAEAKANQARTGNEFLFPILWQHSPEEPIGALFYAEEDGKVGLYVKGMLDLTTPLGRRAFSGMKAGYLRGMSIGYRPIQHHMEAAKGIPGGVRVLDEVELIECSIVTFPAQPLAQVTGVKAAQEARLESLVDDMAHVVSRYGGARKGEQKTMANEKIGRLYINRDYGTKTAAEALHVPEEALKAWLQQEERGDGLVKTPRGGSFTYPGWELCQIVQAHGFDVALIDTRPVGAKAGTPASAMAEAGQYRIEYGRPEESRKEFDRELRRELREGDPDLYGLTPGGKAFNKELQRRQQERTAKQLAERDALVADRKAREEWRQGMAASSFTPDSFAKASGLDVAWVRNWFRSYVAAELVTPIDADTLTLKGDDVRRMGKRDSELLEGRFIQAAHKRQQEAA